MFKANDTVLFQGDSITDAGRDRENADPSAIHALGCGYASHTAAKLMHRHTDLRLNVYNRGVSADKVFQLADRWEDDCLAIKPDVLSILIGVNDHNHIFSNGTGVTVADYERDYDSLLERTRAALPDVILIIGEPFLLIAGEFDETRVQGIAPYREVARKTAEKFGAVWVPYQQAFNDALAIAPADYWAPDGVHPTPAGHMLMAKAWLSAVNDYLRP
jgi:lysophospholipase L1-like esterase